MIHFHKLHGIGNDFIVLDLIRGGHDAVDYVELARSMCNRHKGIGGDGLIFVERGERAPFRMTMLNPDGSNGGMCGNGVRCAAKFVIDFGYQKNAPFDLEVETRILRIAPGEGSNFRVNMGSAVLSRSGIGMMGAPDDTFINQAIQAGGKEWRGTAVSMGNPHIVIFVPDISEINLWKIGPEFENHSLFPFRTNAHFVQVLHRQHAKMVIWERGAGPTLACGSGACAVGVASYLNGFTERRMAVELPGGQLEIEYLPSGEVTMEGPAQYVFSGTWTSQAAVVQR